MTPFFSIITVSYNAEKTILRTLESVKSQTFREIEHIIVDGNSKDGTIKIVESYKESVSDYEVKVLSEPDKGIYDAMNKGLRMASGKFVVFLNSGDKLHSTEVLSNLKTRDERRETKVDMNEPMPKVGVIYGDTIIVDDEGNKIGDRHLTPPERLSWRSFKWGMLVCHQSFYALREICPEYDLNYRYSADVDWCIRVMKEAEKKHLSLVYQKEVLTDYLSEGETTRHHRESLKERFDVMRRHYGLLTTLAMHAIFAVRNLLRSA